MVTVKRRFRIDRRDISFLKYILEATDGLAVLSTVDADNGIVSLAIAPGSVEEVEAMLKDLGRAMMIEDIPEALRE